MISACIRKQFVKNFICKNFKFTYDFTIRVYFVFFVPCQKYVFDNLECNHIDIISFFNFETTIQIQVNVDAKVIILISLAPITWNA